MQTYSKHGFLPLSVVLRNPPLCAVEISLRNIAPCSPLPSGGITRFHQYYEAIRLPVNPLPSSVSCPAYHCLSLCFPPSIGKTAHCPDGLWSLQVLPS